MTHPSTRLRQAPATRGTDTGVDKVRQYLTFSLAGEMYAIRILNVKEIIEYGHLTEVPMMPGFVRGVINLRGAVVPVIDLSSRFGGARTAIGRRTCIVIAELAEEAGPGQVVGVVVDAVSEVVDIPEAQVEPPPSFGANIRSDFIDGLGKIDGKFVILLEVQKVLSIEEMASLADVASEAAADAHA